ncbi:extracellular solute-binding protein [Bacillus sp. FJAT-49711]|uniref:extracellular solute-binding protein n=1 Tax=Bacillus sp. FJAT-49711 TaxID=2833585 RepID=UPI001BC9E339|nr:extracellular solute-binding protein [Bacillus sp. FJAT-49711]MBS4219079.1 extracellular solute-binding protein [Bacillus sp. FJAT-49711]
MKSSKLFFFLLAISIVVILGACSKSEADGSKSSESGDKLPVRYVMPGNAPQDQKEVEAAINEKLEKDGLNLKYEAIYIPWDVWDQKTNLMMSTGEEFELIHIMHDQKGPNVLASSGGIVPIDKYLDEYGSNLKKSLPDWIWDSAKINGETYIVPNFWMDTAYAEGMVTMRTDLLKANNLEAPTSPEELLDVAETLKKNWPEDNKDVYIRFLKEEPPAYLHTTYDTFPFTVFADLVYIDQEGNVKSWIETEEFKKNSAYFREAYNRKLVNPDILTEPVEVTSREEELGRFLYREGEGNNGEANLVKKVPGAKLDIYYLNDKDKFRAYGVRNSNGISSTTDHPEAAIQFLDWMYSSQGNFDLMSYGIKDEHWADSGENKMEILKTNDTGAAAYNVAFWMLGNIEMSRWSPDTHPEFLKTHTTVEDNAVNSITMGFNFDASKVGVEYANCLAELKTSIYPIKLGLVDYDKAFPDALKKMKAAGIDKVVEEYEKQFNEWLESTK